MEAVRYKDGISVGVLPVDSSVKGPLCIHLDFQIQKID